MAVPDTDRLTSAHRLLQAAWAPEISPDEALQAETTFRLGLRGLAGAAAGWFVLVLLAAWLAGSHPEAAFRISDLAFALLIVAALVLVTFFRVPFAGRLLIPFCLVEAGMDPEDLLGGLGAFVLVFGTLLFFLGWGFDAGASPEERRKRPVRSAVLLFLSGGGLAALGLLSWWSDPTEPRVLGVLASILAMVWIWWPAPWLERRRPVLEPDSDSVLRMAGERWLAGLAGILLAVLFGAFPLFLFLNNLGIEDNLKLAGEEVSGGEPFKTGRDLWYWPTAPGPEGQLQGRFLLAGDWSTAEIYRAAGLPEDLAGRLADGELRDKAAAETLRRDLSGFRIASGEEFRELVASTEDSGEAAWFQLMSGELSRKEGERQIFHRLENPLQRLPAWKLEPLRSRPWRWLVNGFLAVCGLLGALLLWRRGADSPVARWLALWMVGWAVALGQPYAELYLPTVTLNLWSSAFTSPLGGIGLMFVSALDFATAAVGGLALLIKWLGIPLGSEGELLLYLPLAFCSIPLAFLWVHLVWPSRSRGRTFAKVPVVLGIFLILLFVDALLAFALPLGESFQLLVGGGLFSVELLAAGAYLRRKRDAGSETGHLGRAAGAAFLCFQGAVLCGFSLGLVETIPAFLPWIGIVLLGAFTGFALWMILARDFLRLTAGWNLGRGALFLALPFLFEISEGLTGALLKQTSFFSPGGQDLLEMIVVVMLLVPLEDVLSRCAPLSIPGLRRVEGAVAQALEALADARGNFQVRRAAAGAFEELGLGEYLLYGRQEEGVFRLLAGSGESSAQEIVPSLRLREHLADWDGRVIDLTRVAYRFSHFFQQFELRRLEESTGCRYLMPVCLGRSLRALLLLPDTQSGHVLCRDLSGAEVGRLGVAAAEAGRAAAAGAE